MIFEPDHSTWSGGLRICLFVRGLAQLSSLCCISYNSYSTITCSAFHKPIVLTSMVARFYATINGIILFCIQKLPTWLPQTCSGWSSETIQAFSWKEMDRHTVGYERKQLPTLFYSVHFKYCFNCYNSWFIFC